MLESLLTIFEKRSPAQLKKFQALPKHLGKEYSSHVLNYLEKYVPYWESMGLNLDTVVDAYLKMVDQYMYYQVKFYKHGKYPYEKDPEGTLKKTRELYENQHDMKAYMAGLSLSLILWKSHYLITRFFRECLLQHRESINDYLEVGVGHGFYFSEAVSLLKKDAKKHALDISPVSLQMTGHLMNFFHENAEYESIQADFLQLKEKEVQFDYIVMGEVVEHTPRPDLFFEKAHQLLRPNGKLFFSTCVNCPMIDHLHRYSTVDEIREMAEKSNLRIVSERIIPAEDLPMSEVVKNKITINYAALAVKDE